MKGLQRPSIGQHRKWASWQQFCLKCLDMSLRRLRTKPLLPEGENALNALLFKELRLAARELSPKGFGYPPIRAECPVQPHGASDESHRRLKATPDITWGYEDDREPDALKATRDFVIECKRIRSPTNSGWAFTVRYVQDGICRFRDSNKRYAEGVACAVMVGYWQNSDFDVLIGEVEAAARDVGFPGFVRLSLGSNPEEVFEFNHVFERPFPVQQFCLEHRWVDLCTSPHPTD